MTSSNGNIFRVIGHLCGVPGEFPAQRQVTRSFNVFFDLRLNKRLSKQWWGWWFETPSHPLWRHCEEFELQCEKIVNEMSAKQSISHEICTSFCCTVLFVWGNNVIHLPVFHYNDVTMAATASLITSLTIVYSTVYSSADQRKRQSSASLAFVREFTGDRWIPRTNGQ